MGDGVNFMGAQAPRVLCYPFQDRRIIGLRQARILAPHDIHLGISAADAAHNILVESFVSSEPQHDCPLLGATPSKETISYPDRVETGLVSLTDLSGALFSFSEVRIHVR